MLGGCNAQVDKSGGEAATEPLVLTGINTRSAEEIQPFVDGVATLSNGALEVAFESGWHKDSATSEAEAIDAVRTGSADFAVVPVRAWHDAGVTSFDALIAPMVVTDARPTLSTNDGSDRSARRLDGRPAQPCRAGSKKRVYDAGEHGRARVGARGAYASEGVQPCPVVPQEGMADQGGTHGGEHQTRGADHR